MAEYFMERTSQDVHPIKSAPFCGGSKACEFEKMEFKELLLVNFIESAKSKRAYPILVPQRRTDQYATESITES